MGLIHACRDDTTEELSISECASAGSVQSNSVLPVSSDLSDYTSFIPSVWMGSSLVLNSYVLTYGEFRQCLCVIVIFLNVTKVSFCQCYFTVFSQDLPFWPDT